MLFAKTLHQTGLLAIKLLVMREFFNLCIIIPATKINTINEFRLIPFIIGIDPSMFLSHHISITWISATMVTTQSMIDTVKTETTFID